jgi:sugar phosphate isomerase/epimerase
MYREFSLAHLSALTLSPQEMVEVAAHCGYSYVGLRLLPVTPTEPRYPLAQDRNMMRETRACIAQSGVGVLDIELARLTPDVDVASFEPMLAAGAELGARHLIAQTPDPDRVRTATKFAKLCELAWRYSLSVNLEFVTWTDTPDLQAAVAVVSAADQPNAGILIDTLHFRRSGCSLEHLRGLPRTWFRFVQVCDAPAEAPATKEGLIHAARNERRLLGEGGLDVRAILDCLPADIPYSLEIPMTTLARMVGPEVRAHMAILSARRYLEAPGVRRNVISGPSRSSAR